MCFLLLLFVFYTVDEVQGMASPDTGSVDVIDHFNFCNTLAISARSLGVKMQPIDIFSDNDIQLYSFYH